jgi:hypothetical protein
MKKLLIILLLVLTYSSYSQVDSTSRYLLCSNVTKTIKYTFNTPRVYKPTPYINLNLNMSKDKFNPEDRKRAFAVLFLSGLAFTTAAILENDGAYGTYQSSPNKTSNYNSTYTTKPFWQQTPRQIMMCLGIGFTIVGGVGMASSK